ncbi:tRNA1Val (adenine37-N6)-methyltransferase [Candidatus Magnetomoraceae bacterium gMMP-15]
MKNDLITYDSLFNGRISIMQKKHGYRFSIDAPLIAHHVCPSSGDTVLDLGTGCGVIPLILACLYPDICIHGVEIQKELAMLAQSNVKKNAFEDRIKIIHQDMKDLKSGANLFDIVVTNPPYYKIRSGRINPDSQKAIARHEIHAALDDILITSRRMLRTAGKIIIIYPVERGIDLLSQMRKFYLEPKRIRMVHSNLSSEAKLIIVEGIKAGRPGLKIKQPVIIYNDDGTYNFEVQAMLAGTSLNKV